MKTNLILDILLIYITICRTVWAQTTNIEPTTQLPGNSEPLTSTTRQTPKTSDNRFGLETNETTTAIEGIDLVSLNTSSDTLAISDTTLKSVDTTQEVVTDSRGNSDVVTDYVTKSYSGNMSPIGTTLSEERQSSEVLSTTGTSVPKTSQIYLTNSSSTEVIPQLMAKSGKQLNFSQINISSETQPLFTTTVNSVGETNQTSTDSAFVSPMTSTSEAIATQESISPTIESHNASNESTGNIGLREGVGNTLKTLIGSLRNMSTSTESVVQTSQTPQSSESPESTPKSTDAPQSPSTLSTGVYPKIDSERTTTTQTSVNYAENDTNSERLYISGDPLHTSAPHRSDQTDPTPDHTLDHQSLSHSSDSIIPTVIYANASDINNNREPEANQSETTTQSSSSPVQSSEHAMLGLNVSEVETTLITHSPIPSSQSTTSASETPQRSSNFGRELQSKTPSTPNPSTTTSQASTESHRSETTESKSSPQTEVSSQTRPYIPDVTTKPEISSTSEPIKSSPQMEIITSDSTHSGNISPVITESNSGIFVANDSEAPVDSQTTFKQPLTDHSLKTTHISKPLTTSTPHETNISLIRVVLPNIKYISSISKEDLVNIVTVTFVAKSIDIFRWISFYDPIFRNHTCNLIDPERNWCSIERFVYLSPSPLITNNHLILNFFIDDSNENDLANYHFFPGPQIVEALKNSTNSLESMISMKVSSLQTNLGTMVVKPLETGPEKLARLDLLLFVFIVVMFICTVLLCLAIICSYAKRKSVDMNQIQLSNAGRRHTTTNGGFDLNPASNILRDENEDKLNHNVINLEGWVAPMDQIDNEKNAKYDNLQDTKL